MPSLLRIGHDHTKIFCKDSPLPSLPSPQTLPYSQESKQQLPKRMPTLFHGSAHWNATQRRAAALLALHLDTEHVITDLPSSPSWLRSLGPSLYLQVRKRATPTYLLWGYPSYKVIKKKYNILHKLNWKLVYGIKLKQREGKGGVWGKLQLQNNKHNCRLRLPQMQKRQHYLYRPNYKELKLPD